MPVSRSVAAALCRDAGFWHFTTQCDACKALHFHKFSVFHRPKKLKK